LSLLIHKCREIKINICISSTQVIVLVQLLYRGPFSFIFSAENANHFHFTHFFVQRFVWLGFLFLQSLTILQSIARPIHTARNFLLKLLEAIVRLNLRVLFDFYSCLEHSLFFLEFFVLWRVLSNLRDLLFFELSGVNHLAYTFFLFHVFLVLLNILMNLVYSVCNDFQS